jgi:hypothetical protein
MLSSDSMSFNVNNSCLTWDFYRSSRGKLILPNNNKKISISSSMIQPNPFTLIPINI